MSNTEQSMKSYRESLEELKRAIDSNIMNLLAAVDNDEPLEPFDIKISIDNKQFDLIFTADLVDDLTRLVNNQIAEFE